MSENIIEGIGAVLSQAREAKGLSVSDVAEKLKLTPRQIEAIEAEDLSRLPSPVFVRGFVRNYARLVEVPMEEIPAAVESSIKPTATITAHSEDVVISTSPMRRWLLLPLAGLALFMILVAVLYNWLRQGEEAYLPAATASQPATRIQAVPLPAVQSPPQTAVPVAQDVPVPPPNTNGATPPSTVAVPAAPASPPAVAASVPTTPAALAPAVSTKPVPVVPVTPQTTVAPAVAPVAASPVRTNGGNAYEYGDAMAAGHVVRVSAVDEDSWVEVASGDGRRYSQLLRAGDQMTVHGVSPIQLVVGNGAHTRVVYDGKHVDLQPYTGDKVARVNLK